MAGRCRPVTGLELLAHGVGGFLGIGEDHYPIPWEKLTYNTSLDAYELDITEDQLRGAPRFSPGTAFDYSRSSGGQRLADYYNVPPYWM